MAKTERPRSIRHVNDVRWMPGGLGGSSHSRFSSSWISSHRLVSFLWVLHH